MGDIETARDLGITQTSAWFLNHRIRFALHTGSIEKMSGHVEVDETFIGGKARNMGKAKRARKVTGTGGKDKVIVMGILERGGKVHTSVLDNRRKKAIQAEVREHVEAGAAIFSDELKSYQGLEPTTSTSLSIMLSSTSTATSIPIGMENFLSLVKRGRLGTYISLEPFHLFRYLDEQAYRFNNRKVEDFDRFKMAASQILGKWLTWDHLTGKQLDPQTCVN